MSTTRRPSESQEEGIFVLPTKMKSSKSFNDFVWSIHENLSQLKIDPKDTTKVILIYVDQGFYMEKEN
jgi:hypothetical protein